MSTSKTGRKIIRKKSSEKEAAGQLIKRVNTYRQICEELEAENSKIKARSSETINLLKKSHNDLTESVIVYKKLLSFSETSLDKANISIGRSRDAMSALELKLFQEEKKNTVKFSSGSGMVVSNFLNFYLITNVERYFFDSYRIF